MTGRHRASGRHRKPVPPNPARRKFTLRVVCGCAACAVVIPLFTQPSASANPPDLTSARPVLTVVPPISTPVVTLQPSVDAIDMTAVNGEPAKHHSKPKDTSSDSSSSSSGASSGSDDTTPSTTRKDTGDYHQITPPVPACQ
jgi:hypothetical protein